MKHSDYKVGWIAALPLEFSAAQSMLDEVHGQLPRLPFDDNIYSFGKIANHNVVLACLPAGSTGTVSAATVARQLRNSFPSVTAGLLVGIGGAVPSSERDIRLKRAIQYDIRLGDIVVSQPSGESGGVIQWDFGKTVQGGRFTRTGSLNAPPEILLSALSSLQAQHRMGTRDLDSIVSAVLQKNPHMSTICSYQGKDRDQLFEAEYDHPLSESTCANCDPTKLVMRPSRGSSPVIHYGTIASGNQVMRHGSTREKLAKDLDVLCFEMEAAGLMNNYPCLVVRGIADYADSHKNKGWQDYAAIVAAAYAKELLSILPIEQEFGLPEINQLTLETQSTSPVYLTSLPVTRPWFFGRQQELAEMSRILDPQNPGHKCLVLCSVGGLGKTKLALRYLELEGASYDLVLWIDMSTQRNTQLSFSEAASSLENFNIASKSSFTTARDSSKAEVTFVKNWLEKTSKTWLMILDSLDDVEHHDAWALLPKCKRGSIVVTSTRMDFAQYWTADILEVSGLDHEAGAHLLLHQLNASTRAYIALDEAKIVVNELSGIPLAIEQASAFLSSGFSVDEFRKYYSTRYKDLMSRKPSASGWSYDKNKSVFETFEALHEAMAQKDPNIVNLLALISFFGATEVPVAIFQNLDQNLTVEDGLFISKDNLIQGKEAWFYEKLDWLKAWCIDGYFVRITVNQLEHFCLVKTRKTKNGSLQTIAVHNAVSLWARERHVAKEAASWCILASYVLGHFLESLGPESGKSAAAQKVSTHVHFAFSCISQYVYRDLISPSKGKFRHFYAYICNQFAIHFYEFRQFTEAKKALLDLINYCKVQQSQQWPIDRPSLDIMVRLRDSYWELGEWENAQRLNSELLASPAMISERFDDIAVDANSMGHRIRDQLERARAAAERASRRDMPKSLPHEPPETDVPTNSSNIKEVLNFDENYQDELYTLKETLSQMQEEFGDLDRDTLEARLKLARFYEKHEQYSEAVVHLVKISELMELDRRRVHLVIEKFESVLNPTLDLLVSFIHRTDAVKQVSSRHWGYVLLFVAFTDADALAKALLAYGEIANSDSSLPLALQLTAIRNSEQVFSMLLDFGVDVNKRTYMGRSALHTAAINGREKMVEALLDRGATIEAVDRDGCRPLHFASGFSGLSSVSMMKTLLDRGANINSSNSHEDFPLLYAIDNEDNSIERIQVLINRGADVEHANKANNTALHIAGVRNAKEPFEFLAKIAKHVGSKGKDGFTPLHLAALRGWTTATQILIERKADINAGNNSGKTPLDYALEENHEAVVKILLEHGAKAKENADQYRESGPSFMGQLRKSLSPKNYKGKQRATSKDR